MVEKLPRSNAEYYAPHDGSARLAIAVPGLV